MALIFFFAFAFAACGGYSKEDAETKCNLERQAKSACFTDKQYTECVSCFEECGDDCKIAESCPLQYFCSP
jgi:hypothetical protein